MRSTTIACTLALLATPLVATPPATPAASTPAARAAAAAAAAPPAEAAWIATSNQFTNRLLAIEMKHRPETGSDQGLAEYDARVSQPTRADDDALRAELEAALASIQAAIPQQKEEAVAQDLRIIERRLGLQFRQLDFARAHEVPFLNASGTVFRGLRTLLDEQTAAERRPAAVTRLRAYAGMVAGYRPLTEILQERVREQMAKPGVTYPWKDQIETELGRNATYLDGIAKLMEKYQLQGWQEPLAKLKAQLADYDAWTRTTLLPKARTDFRLPPEEYSMALEGFGVDIPPAQLAATAHQAFADIQAEMAPIAAQIAAQRQLPSNDYRAVIRELKKQQLVGDAILPFYEKRLQQIEKIIVEQKLVTLPDRPARIRIASAAETAQQPAPHMQPPPFLHNTGQKGEFVLPLNMPAAPGKGAAEQYDDFTYDAAAWTLTAHEARPGHELQFDSMLERGVSLARVRYAMNSTNAEGWGLYSEYLIKPYMPLEGQLVSLDMRLQRAARAFLDPELQAGKIQPAEAYRVLQEDVVLSHAMAQQEVERYTFRSPGQATSYFYGFTRLVALRKEVEAALGSRFDAQRFHDFVLSQGLLPPDLMREAVLRDFVPAQKAAAPSR